MLVVLAFIAATYAHPEQLVDTEWVAAHHGDAHVRIVDMRRGGYAEGHVPDAVPLAPEAIRDALNPPTFLPSPAAFELMMAKLGISNDTRVVTYDERGGIYAARLWWILNYFGHSNVALVNGGGGKREAQPPPGSKGARAGLRRRVSPPPPPQNVATPRATRAANPQTRGQDADPP